LIRIVRSVQSLYRFPFEKQSYDIIHCTRVLKLITNILFELISLNILVPTYFQYYI